MRSFWNIERFKSVLRNLGISKQLFYVFVKTDLKTLNNRDRYAILMTEELKIW